MPVSAESTTAAPPPPITLAAGPGARWERWAFASLVASVFTSPFGSNLHLYGHPSIFPYRVCIVLFLVFEGMRVAVDRSRRPRLHLLHPAAWMAGLALWGTCSVLWAADHAAAGRSIVFLWQAALLVYALSVYGRERRRLAVLLAAGAAALLVVIACAFYERSTGYHFPESMLRAPDALQFQFLFTSVFHNGNDLATFLALWMPLMLVLYLAESGLLLRLVGLLVALLCGFLIVYSLSRANTVAVALSMLVMLPLSVRRRTAAWLALVVVVGLAHIFMPVMPKYFITQAAIRLVRETREGFSRDQTRAQLNHECLLLVRQTHGLGVGAGNAETALKQLRRHGNATGTDIVDPHNWWLEVMADLGVVGFALYTLLYLRLLAGLFLVQVRAAARDPALSFVSLGLLAGLVGFALGCISSSSVLTLNAVWIEFGFAGAVLEIARAERRPRTSSEAPRPAAEP